MSRSNVHEAPFVGPPWWIAYGWLAAALISQITIMHYVAIRGVAPSLVLVAVVWYAVRVDSRRAAIYGLIAGLMEDILATHTGGAFTISTTVVAIVTGMLSRGFFADSIVLVSLLTAVATIVRNLLFWTVMGVQGYPGGLAVMHAHQTLAEAVMNVAVMIVALLIVRRIDNQFG